MAKPQVAWCTFVLVNNVLAPTGLYASEGEAVNDCTVTEGVAALPLSEKFPMFISELPKAYWPHIGTWKTSRNHQIQQRARAVVQHFFEGALR